MVEWERQRAMTTMGTTVRPVEAAVAGDGRLTTGVQLESTSVEIV